MADRSSSQSAEPTTQKPIHPINNSMTATVQLQDTTVLLDSLYTGYQTILDEAKAQLENIQIPATAIQRISDRLATDRTMLATLRKDAVNELCDNIANDVNSPGGERKLVDTLAVAVGNKLADELQRQLDERLNTMLDDKRIEKIIMDRIDQSPELQSAVATKATLKQAFALAFDLDLEPVEAENKVST
jgi:hypothetical protein